MKKRILSIILTVMMIVSIIPFSAIPASAEGDSIPYIYRYWHEETKKVLELPLTASATAITQGMTTLNDEWYYVSGTVTISERITVNGNAEKPTCIILTDGAKLDATAGIKLSSEGALFIYGQTEGNGMLNATYNPDNYMEDCPGIDCGDGCTVTINGGTVNATGYYGAGIGGSGSGSGGTVTINGGTVTATGGAKSAGIGGGDSGSGGTVTINGGTVTATGGRLGAGIGGGNSGSSGTVTINGGTVIATGGDDGVGIGSGNSEGSGTVTINGGTVTATGSGMGRAGIGGNNRTTVTINGGTVTAFGAPYDGAGIGGSICEDGTVIINGGTVNATGGNGGGVGIGGNYGSFPGLGNTVIINGGTVNATGGDGCAAIGGNAGCTTITINGGTVNATGGKDGAAGIGGGNDLRNPGCTVNINGGAVTAIASGNADGIGGGGYDPVCSSAPDKGTLTVAEGAAIKAGDAKPGDETTVEAYTADRKAYVFIHYHVFEDGKCCYCDLTLTSIDIPAAEIMYYTGEEQSLPTGDGYTLSGDFKATDVGIYSVIATLDSGYIWSDDSTTPKTVFWAIVPGATHEHSFATEYSYNELCHWQAATCEHTELTKNLAEHTFDENGKCTVCGYEKKTDALTEAKTAMKEEIDKAVNGASDAIVTYAATAKANIDACTSITELVGVYTAELNKINGMKTDEAIAAATEELEELDVISTKAKAIVRSVKPVLATASSPAEVEEVMKQAKNGINAAEEKVTDTDRHIVNRLPVETGNLMGHQYKTVNGKVINDVGRAIICLSEEQLNKIKSDKVVVVGGDFEKETTFTLDCAYTYFYAGNTKYTAEDVGCAAFLIIDCDAAKEAISGFGYYRVYDGSADSEDNFILDALYVNPNN